MTHKNSAGDVRLLLDIMQRLRAPDGCPWDAEQTPESLTPYIQEEACELIDAIEEQSTEHILDELGDLLLQVVFVAQIFKERQAFDFDAVVERISAKLIRRHPHVFEQDNGIRAQKDLDRQWEQIKKSETTGNKSCLADHLPNKLPALQRAQKLTSRLKRDGREAELPDLTTSLEQSLETLASLERRPLDQDALGHLLLTVVRAAQACGIDAESALRKATRDIVKELER